MRQDPPTLDDLIQLVKTRTDVGDDLTRLSEASCIASELNSVTDRLLNHFVQQARDSGISWAQIGQQLGISKQGAQQRFTGQSRLEDLPHQLRELGVTLEEKFLSRSPSASGGLLQKVRSAFKPQRFTAAARQVVILSQEEARNLGSTEIGSEHLVLGLLREETGIASSTLRSMGVTYEQLRSQVTGDRAPAQDVPDGHVPFAAEARTALETAMTESANLRHNYIGTEHVLLGILKEENLARQMLKELHIDVDHLTDEVSRLLERL